MNRLASPLRSISAFLVARARFYDGPAPKRRRPGRLSGPDAALWPYSFLWPCRPPGGPRHDEQAPPACGGADEARFFGWLYIR